MAFEPIDVVDGARSPLQRPRNAPGPFAAADLAVLLPASLRAVEDSGLEPIGRISDRHWAALEPEQIGLGPVHAAFAALVLACQAAWENPRWCAAAFGTPAWGRLDDARLNAGGGAMPVENLQPTGAGR